MTVVTFDKVPVNAIIIWKRKNVYVADISNNDFDSLKCKHDVILKCKIRQGRFLMGKFFDVPFSHVNQDLDVTNFSSRIGLRIYIL